MKTQNKCKHRERYNSLVTFKDGSEHIQRTCTKCSKHLGYLRQGGFDKTKLKKEKTKRQINEELGIPNGCRACGEERGCGSDGFCFLCRKKPIKNKIKNYAKCHGLTVWQLSKEQIFEVLENE